MTCFGTCDGCGGWFYYEHLYVVTGDSFIDDEFYCHCCSLERGLPWQPYVEPAWGRVVAVEPLLEPQA